MDTSGWSKGEQTAWEFIEQKYLQLEEPLDLSDFPTEVLATFYVDHDHPATPAARNMGTWLYCYDQIRKRSGDTVDLAELEHAGTLFCEAATFELYRRLLGRSPKPSTDIGLIFELHARKSKLEREEQERN